VSIQASVVAKPVGAAVLFALLIALVFASTGCNRSDAPATEAAPPPAPDRPSADLIVSGGRIWTGDDENPWAEAIAIGGDRILAVGSSTEIAKLQGADTRVIDGAGRLVTPGFIDTHVHFAWGGDGLASVQLRDAATPAEFTTRIAAHAASLPAGEWVLNGTWDHENWGGELPTRDWIDAATADHPVWVTRLDGHMGLANTRALELAGVTADTPDIPGGAIERDAEGRPTGVLKDNAMSLVEAVVPEPSPEQVDRMIRAAMAHVAAQGVTTVHDMTDWASLDAYRRARQDGWLRTRVHAYLPLADWERLATSVKDNGRGDAWLRVDGLKGFMDGSLGSHTAAFFEPFTDAPGDRGLLINEPADVERWIAHADAAGLQVVVHAIGDRAISLLLDAFERVAETEGPRDRRFRIEHAQHIHPDDIARFAELDVIASMQPYHAIDDGRWAEKVIGPERARTTYAFASLLEAGARVAFGSDWPVAPPTPLEGIYAAVTRATLDGANPGGWVPEQKVGVADALRAYTREGAWAGFAEGETGLLRAGLQADLVVLDRDITAIAPEAIREAQVLLTVVGGIVAHDRLAPANDPATSAASTAPQAP
jgi:predicted amidohydrolase YtcJ